MLRACRPTTSTATNPPVLVAGRGYPAIVSATRPDEFVAPTFGQRLGGRIVDGLVLSPLFFLIEFELRRGVFAVVAFGIAAGYEVGCVAIFGKTLGKHIVGTSVMSTTRDPKPELSQAIVRFLALGAPIIALDAAGLRLLAEVWAAIVIVPILHSPLHRGLHDYAARTIVVPTRIPAPR